jgi:hypothetical protein
MTVADLCFIMPFLREAFDPSERECLMRVRAFCPLTRRARHGELSRESNKNVSRIFASWNQLDGWLRRADALRKAA